MVAGGCRVSRKDWEGGGGMSSTNPMTDGFWLDVQDKRVAELEVALADLVDRQHDYPADLSRDREWFAAFDRARGLLDGCR